MGLQPLLTLYLVLPMVIIYALVTWFGLAFVKQMANEKLRSDLELVGRAIRLPVSEALAKNDLTALQSNLESVFSIGRVYGASVFDKEGKLVTFSGVTEKDLSRSNMAELVVQTGEQQDGYRSVEGRDVYSYFLPITDRHGEVSGLLQITRRASDFERSFDKLARLAWLSWAGLVLVTLGILFLGHHRAIGRYVSQLVSSMRRVAQGDHKHRATESGPREIRELINGLNQMLDSITAAEAEISAHRHQEYLLQEQLKEKEKMAAIGQVARGVAHELGAPLTVIDGRAQRLSRQTDDADSLRQLAAVRGQVKRLTRMVQQLLDFSRHQQVQTEKFDITDLVNQAVENLGYEMLIDSCKIDITSSSAQMLIGDPQRLELALINILRNAVQAAQNAVTIHWHQVAESLLIHIEDDGPGLATPQQSEKLLSPFYTTKNQGEGTGLGLTIAAHIIKDHRGELSLGNRKNGGCRVTVRLPLPEHSEHES
ncbi:two-component sensor histidine kinase [Lacimicrobium alkaliphilum]|uniref:histidine kinase n=2 Tax=Lacimicrobium alkaliphilum TaxID=1526571 RepID=A0ABQ1RJN2_9ALTE|nr:two-component sensor histidine kinase [Lacimicrobium alkaliphilum]